jgi:hypothetical protein
MAASTSTIRVKVDADFSSFIETLRHLADAMEAQTSAPKGAAEPDADEVKPTHDLVVSLGDCEFPGSCSCGKPLGTIRPNQSTDILFMAWERHVMTEVPIDERGDY